MQFIINSETPSKKNSRITLKNGRTIPSKRYMAWHKEAMNELAVQLLLMRDFKKIDSPVIMRVDFVHGDKRKRDSDNQLSSILDLLQDCGVLADDCWEICRGFCITNVYEKDSPRVVVEIEKIGEENL